MSLANTRLGFFATIALAATIASQVVCSAEPNNFSRQSDASHAEYERCIPKPYGYDWAHAMCALEYLEREYTILGEQLDAILPTLHRGQRAGLKQSQRKWEAEADRKCDADSHYIGEKYPGTMQIVDFKSCKAFETNLRIEWLEEKYGRRQR